MNVGYTETMNVGYKLAMNVIIVHFETNGTL